MSFDRTPVAKLDRRRALAEQIVARYPDGECEFFWELYIRQLAPRAMTSHLVMRKTSPEIMAELLEPGALERLVVADD